VKVANPIPKIIVLGLITAGALIILAYYYTTAGGRLPLAGHLYTVTAQISDPQELLKHADVRAAGVKVGSVGDVRNSVVDGQTVANVQMQLNGDYTPIYGDATVLMRQKTLVGENYVEVTRGHPSAGQVPDGGMLSLSHDLEAVPLDKILNALTPTVRQKIRTDLQTLGSGLSHEGTNLNAFLGGLQPTVQNGGVVFGVLNAQKQQVADVVQQTGTLMRAFANRTQDLRTLISAAEVTAQAVAARDISLEQSFVQLPATLAQARTSVGVLSSFAGSASPVISNLRVAVLNLQPVFAQLQPTAIAAQQLFASIPPFLKVANPLLSTLKRFSRAAKPAVAPLEALLRQANPVISYLAPYKAEIGGLLENFGNTGYFGTDGEYLGRCLCPISVDSYAGFTPAQQALVQALIKAGGLGGIANPTYNPYRKPGTLPNASTPFSGNYQRITAEPPAGMK
jgi:ABC-type transporter Mla subunit MlaD